MSGKIITAVIVTVAALAALIYSAVQQGTKTCLDCRGAAGPGSEREGNSFGSAGERRTH